MKTNLIPAAQYLRMSTRFQQYSLEHQSAAIQKYAAENGFGVVNTYSDAAKSGLVLKNRLGMRRLLQDVVKGPPYKAILVYDVSRWGRFLDSDEAASYEFVCRSSGVPVHYCAEPFPNDNSLSSVIIKTLKRLMAAEYSRELSVKVYEGLLQISKLGFRTGGPPGYGLRRMLISARRAMKHPLGSGDRKSLKTDRVILVPGPEEETNCVREIFRLFTQEHMMPTDIAQELNRRGIRYAAGTKRKQWCANAVNRILKHPKYAGYNVYGRRSQRLKTPNISVPKERWVITPNCWKAIVSQSAFDEAQRIFGDQTIHKSDTELLDSLRSLLRQHGKIRETLVNESPDCASTHTYAARFGSLTEASRLIGYESPRLRRVMTNRNLRSLRNDLIEQIVGLAPEQVDLVRADGHFKPRLRVSGRFVVCIYICRAMKTQNGGQRWILETATPERRCPGVIARLTEDNQGFLDFHIVPALPNRARYTIKPDDDILKNGRQLFQLGDFVTLIDELMCAEQPLSPKEEKRNSTSRAEECFET